MSATEAPPPEAPQPAPPPERYCARCGSTLGPDQDWCLACGAAVTTHVAPPRGWRVPLVAAAALIVLAIAAAVIAIAELSRGPERVAQAPSPTPSPAATLTPSPSATPTPFEGGSTPTPNPGATPSPGATTSPGVTPSPSPGTTPSPAPGATPSPSTSTSFADWPSGRSAWTVILESARTRSGAEQVAQSLQSRGDTVGILHSDDFPTLNKGYWVVFSGQYDSRKAAEDAMSSLPAERSGAYVRHVSSG